MEKGTQRSNIWAVRELQDLYEEHLQSDGKEGSYSGIAWTSTEGRSQGETKRGSPESAITDIDGLMAAVGGLSALSPGEGMAHGFEGLIETVQRIKEASEMGSSLRDQVDKTIGEAKTNEVRRNSSDSIIQKNYYAGGEGDSGIQYNRYKKNGDHVSGNPTKVTKQDYEKQQKSE